MANGKVFKGKQRAQPVARSEVDPGARRPQERPLRAKAQRATGRPEVQVSRCHVSNPLESEAVGRKSMVCHVFFHGFSRIFMDFRCV